jgi:NAD(P)-dependent dehydrogenase (short-subunit alcohol dehydrogenase family)
MATLRGRTYVVTGAQSGIGAATVASLRDDGARVITLDLAEPADVVFDMGNLARIEDAVTQLEARSSGLLDGIISCAGVGPTGRSAARLLAVNAFGPIQLLTRLRRSLEIPEVGQAVVVSSNTISCHPNPISSELVESCLSKDHEEMLERVDREITSEVAYAVSKRVLTTWARRQAPTAEWIGRGIRLNVVAPGSTDTAMFAERTTDAALQAGAASFPNPLGRLLEADEIAHVIRFVVDPSTTALCGSVVFCDGGPDSLFHPDQPDARISIP